MCSLYSRVSFQKCPMYSSCRCRLKFINYLFNQSFQLFKIRSAVLDLKFFLWRPWDLLSVLPTSCVNLILWDICYGEICLESPQPRDTTGLDRPRIVGRRNYISIQLNLSLSWPHFCGQWGGLSTQVLLYVASRDRCTAFLSFRWTPGYLSVCPDIIPYRPISQSHTSPQVTQTGQGMLKGPLGSSVP